MSSDLNATINRARDGDPLAFEQLHERFQRFVLEQISRRLPEFRRDDAEEVSQEVWHAIHRQLPSYDASVATFTRWLAVIATRKAITYAKKMAVRRDNLERLAAVPLEGCGEDPARRSEAREILEAVKECAGLLLGRERQVFGLVRFHELDMSQVAEMLSISPGRVRGALSEAGNKVLDCLRGKEIV